MSAGLILFSLVIVVLAGFINGSFATPTKYMGKWKEENIWFSFSFFAFIIFPWLTIYIMAPYTFELMGLIPTATMLGLLLGGFVFGLGQIFFALCLRLIGLGLGFVVNISIGTACTALIPLLWYSNLIGSLYSLFLILGVVVFIVAVVLGAYAGSAREKALEGNQATTEKKETNKKTYHTIGVIFAILAGIGSACEGLAYTFGNPVVSKIAQTTFDDHGLSATLHAWGIIMLGAFIPYALYFLYLCVKNKSFSAYKEPKTGKYWLFLPVMAFGYWFSLVFFSKSSVLIGGNLAPTIAWPLFMVFIILTSNFWGWFSGEWKNAGSKAIRRIWCSIIFLVIAIIIFAASAVVKPLDIEGHKNIEHHIHGVS